MEDIPNTIILDIDDAVRPLMLYIEKGYHKDVFDCTGVLNNILHHVCNDDPLTNLANLLEKLDNYLSMINLDILDILDLLNLVEQLGHVVVSKFSEYGFYNLEEPWEYEVGIWCNPTSCLLVFTHPYEFNKVSGVSDVLIF